MVLTTVLAFQLAPAVAKALLKLWLKDHEVAHAISDTLTDMLVQQSKDAFAAREGARTFEAMGEKIVKSLEPLFAESAELQDGDKAEVAEALSARISAVDADGTLAVTVDMDAAAYERHLRENEREATARFSEAQTALYSRVLGEAARRIVEIAVKLPEFTASTLVEVLRRETQLLSVADRILAELAQISDVVNRIDSPIRVQAFEKRYREAVRARLDWTELFGADLTDASKRQPLTTAYVTMTALGRSGNGDGSSGGYEVSVDDALRAGTRLLLRGDPGSGKTTLLKWAAVRAAYGDFDERLSELNDAVPFFLRLREFVDVRPDGEALLSRPNTKMFAVYTVPALAEEPPGNWLDDRLRSGRAFVLVDGVDEVPEAKRDDVHEWLANVIATYPQARYLITSRSAAVSADWLNAQEFLSYELQPMTPDAVFRFVDRWHRAAEEALPAAVDRARVQPLAAQLQKTMAKPEQRALRRLASNPLLCALICALHLDRNGQLPRDRVELYDACCDMLAWRRDAESHVRAGSEIPLDKRQRLALLEVLAYWMMQNGRATIPLTEAADKLEPYVRQMQAIPDTTGMDKVVNLLLERTGLVRELVKGELDFSHLTLQEFLSARAALTASDEGFLLDRASEDRWREVIVLAAALGTGTASASTRTRGILSRFRTGASGAKVSVSEWLILELIRRGDRDPNLRARCHLLAMACMDRTLALSEETRKAAGERMRSLVPPRTLTNADALAGAGDVATPFLAATPDMPAGIAAACVRSLVRIGTELARETLRGYRDDLRPEVRAQWVLGAEVNPVDGARLVVIPAGDFVMGASDIPNAQPQRTVFLDDYRIYSMPVTVAQYRKFCDATGWQMPPPPSFNKAWGKEDHPIVNVCWEDANAYCNWLTQETGSQYVLPTEAQWEKAARGPHGLVYPWGDGWDAGRCANSVGSKKLTGTVAVGAYPPGASSYGCLDMAGNVWEWCSDWYDKTYYQKAPLQNPAGPVAGTTRVVRGGAWNFSKPGIFRAACRDFNRPDIGDGNFGFRVALQGSA